MNKAKKRRGGLVVLLVIVVLLALLCAAPFVINALSHYDYDDYAALAAANAALVDLSADADGAHLLFRMDKSDVYSALLESDALAQIEAEAGGRIGIERIGYSLHPREDGSDAEAEICAAAKLFGFVPVQLCALADVSVTDAGALLVTLKEVRYGPFIRFGAEKLARWTGMDELAEGFTISLEDWAEPLRADKVRLEGDGLCFSSALLSRVLDEVAAMEAPRELRLLRLYFGDGELPSAFFDEGREAFIRSAGSSLDALRKALRDVVVFSTDEYRRELIANLSALPFDLTSELEALSVSEVWEAVHARILEAQAHYHETQTELRHDYWYKNVVLSKQYLLGADGEPLESRLPAEWEARIVLQYNENYDAIVKTNEGNPRLQVPIPGLPKMSELPRTGWDALPPEGDGPFDLTLALRLPSGTPAVVFLTAEDEFGLAVISEQLFKEIREKDRLPIYSSASVASAPRETWLRLYQGEDQLNAYYINVP